MTRSATVAGALVALAASCARAAEDRATWLQRTLTEQHRALLARDRGAVAAKYARMAHDPFSFFRGARALAARAPSRHVTPESSQVALVGDPHPENVGTFVSGAGARVVDFNDFDEAGYGAYVDDLRRLAVSLWVTADMARLGRKQRRKVVARVVDGYCDELRDLAAGKPALSLRVADAFDGELERLLATPDAHAADEPEVSAEERRTIDALLNAYPKTLHDPGRFARGGFALKRAWRRSAGVSSHPLVRYRVLVEGPTARDDDDWLLEAKESPRPAALIVKLQRQLQEFPDDDPWLGWAEVGGRSFRFRSVGPQQRRLDVERIVAEVRSPRWKKGDLREFGHDLGRLLARGHARAQGRDGRPGLEVIRIAIGAAQEGLTGETIEYVEKEGDQLQNDLATFRDLLRRKGPLLGVAP